MTDSFFANRYREVAIRTANPLQLIVILYDAAILSLREAREFMEKRDIEGRTRATNKCIAIISELQSSLNLKDGGDIARSLNRLYDYMKGRIIAGNAQQDPEPLTETEALLVNLRSAWRALTEQSGPATEQRTAPELPAAVFAAAEGAAFTPKSFNVSI